MRSRGVRLDLFICMVLAAFMFWGIWQVGSYFGVLEKAFDWKRSERNKRSGGW